jgi:hypothetical protein
MHPSPAFVFFSRPFVSAVPSLRCSSKLFYDYNRGVIIKCFVTLLWPLQRISLHSNVSVDTLANHLGDLGGKQLFTKTGYYKVRYCYNHIMLYRARVYAQLPYGENNHA